MNLVPGQFVTVRGGGFFGWLIRTFTRAPVAHVYVYVGPLPNGFDMVEAEPGGVRYGRTSDHDPATSYPSRQPWTEAESAKAQAEALALVGTPYGLLADALIGMREGLRWRWVPSWLFKTKAVTSHEECAQLADYVAMQAGVHYFADGRQPGSVSPADLWRLDYGNDKRG